MLSKQEIIDFRERVIFLRQRCEDTLRERAMPAPHAAGVMTAIERFDVMIPLLYYVLDDIPEDIGPPPEQYCGVAEWNQRCEAFLNTIWEGKF